MVGNREKEVWKEGVGGRGERFCSGNFEFLGV